MTGAGLVEREQMRMKLTKLVKQAILEAALNKAGINEKKAAIRARYADWFETVRTSFVTPEVTEKVNAANKHIKDLDPCLYVSVSAYKSSYIRANVGGQWRRIYWCGAQSYGEAIDSDHALYAPYEPVISADNPFAQQLYAIDHDSTALSSEIEQLKVSLNAVLDSASTDKRLIEIWPEAVAFIPAAEKANTPQLPALPIAELNKLIGLP